MDIVLEQISYLLPIMLVAESNCGLSCTRYTVVTADSDDYLLWIDDDVTVVPNEIREYS